MPPKQAAAPTFGIDALPSRMQSKFREVTRCHESKDYARGLNIANEILAAHPTHPDTLAFKAFTIHSQDPLTNKTAAYDLVKMSLIHSRFQSPVCWHVLAQMHRDDYEYSDALAAMKKASDLSTDPASVLRDVSYLQLRVGDYKGFEATRLRLLQLQFSQGLNWILYAAAHQLVGSYLPAFHIASIYLATVVPSGQSLTEAGGDSASAYELCEIRRYMAGLMHFAGRHNEAIEYLRSEESRFVDKVAYHTLIYRAAAALDKSAVMEKSAAFLCKYNPEDFNNVIALLRARQLKRGVKRTRVDPPCKLAKNILRDPAAIDGGFAIVPPAELWSPSWWNRAPAALRESVCAELDALPTEFAGLKPDAYLNRTLAVSMAGDGAVGRDFGQRLTRVLKRYITRMIPSLAGVLKPLYSDPIKVPIVDAALRNVVASLTACGRLPHGDDYSASAATDESDPVLPPNALPWTLVALASHHKRCGRLADALKAAEEAITHSPTMEVARMRLAKLLLRNGDKEAAVEQMHHARRLDLSDRNINSETVKLLLKAGPQYAFDADRTYAILDFSLQDDQGIHPLSSAIEFQVMWLYLAEGAMHLRSGDLVSAVRHYSFVDHVTSELPDDVELFVGYAVRKGTMTTLLETLEHEANKYASVHYVTAAVGIITALLAAEKIVAAHPDGREGGAKELVESRQRFTRRTRFRGKYAGKDTLHLPPRPSPENATVLQGRGIDLSEDPAELAAEQALQEKLWAEKERTLRLPVVDWKNPIGPFAQSLVERLQAQAGAYPTTHIIAAEYYLARIGEDGSGLARVLQALKRLAQLIEYADKVGLQLPRIRGLDTRTPAVALKELLAAYDTKYTAIAASVPPVIATALKAARASIVVA